MARPITGPALVHRLDGSDAAKHKAEVLLATLTGRCTIDDAADQLGVTRAYVFVLRDQLLTGAIAAVEPRLPGPKRDVLPADPERAALAEALGAADRRAKDLEIALELERCRAELALILPQRSQKNGRRQRRRR